MGISVASFPKVSSFFVSKKDLFLDDLFDFLSFEKLMLMVPNLALLRHAVLMDLAVDALRLAAGHEASPEEGGVVESLGAQKTAGAFFPTL